MSHYIPGDLLDEAMLAVKANVPIGDIAQRLGLEVSDLQQRLGLPQWRQIPDAKSDDTSFDLFRTEELDGVL